MRDESLVCRQCGIAPVSKVTATGSYYFECPNCHQKSICAVSKESARKYWKLRIMRVQR